MCVHVSVFHERYVNIETTWRTWRLHGGHGEGDTTMIYGQWQIASYHHEVLHISGNNY